MDGITPPPVNKRKNVQKDKPKGLVYADLNTNQKPKNRLQKYSDFSFYVKAANYYTSLPFLVQVFATIMAITMVMSLANQIMLSIYNDNAYKLGAAQLILPDPSEKLGNSLHYLGPEEAYVYNLGYKPSVDVAGTVGGPKFSAKINANTKDGVEVTDSVNNISMTMKPKFDTLAPQQEKNRLVMPLKRKNAALVYTLGNATIKEDIILNKYISDTLTFDYELDLNDGLEARMENDGSIGIYGTSQQYLLGEVSTGTDQDAELLQKARQNAQKDKIIFRIPAPFIVEPNNRQSDANAWYSLDGNKLSVHAANLKTATYPLSIDPSVYIETASKLMRGNNESNIDFNVANELILKGSTTGARFDDWVSTLDLNEPRAFGGSAAYGGYIYVVGGASEGGLVTSTYSTPGSTTYSVPAGVTQVTVKSWGAGGGGGGASPDRIGGDGGGGGYATATFTVTPSETLTVRVGGGGTGGTGFNTGTNSGNGGGGGGYSGVLRSTTPLIIAAGGGGGGGGNGDTGSTARAPGTVAGGGGGTTGIAGTDNGATYGGKGGTQVAGGVAGVTNGVAGSSLAGGNGGSPGGTATGGGTNGGGGGGIQQNSGGPNKRPGGGGGGGGYYGGGGGGQRTNQYEGGAGGGGGSSYTTGSPASTAAASGTVPGNFNDTNRGTAGNGGAGGAVGTTGTSGSAGLVIISYATGGAGAVHDNVYWAKLSTTNGSIESPNPGNGACAGWCTDTAYDLPAERIGHSVVAYNGFLYAFGGVNDSGTRQSTVYIAKIGANGEPSLWHPTDTNKNNWVYWYSATALSTERSYFSAVAYNNRMYILGGQNNSNTGGVTTVEYANINPNGTLSAWSTTGMSTLPSARFGHTAHVYNDYIYLIGGNSGGTLQNTVYYTKLKSDGTMNSWISTTSFPTARMTAGGTFSVIYGGYLYITGGCSAVDGSGYCSTVRSDTILASINADGSLTDWGSIADLVNIRMGHSLVAWRNAIYGIGGCVSQSPLNGQCIDLISTSDYGVINQDGDASTVSDSVDIGTGVCSGSDPYDCDLPPLGDGNGQGGGMGGGTIINNGYIYYIGGCRAVSGTQICYNGGASRTTDTIYYAQIATDGTLHRPANCTATNIQYAGNWCVDNSHTINNGTGLAAFAHTVFNNTIYAMGGTTGPSWQSTVYYTTLNADGSLNSWSTQTFANVGLGSAKGYQYAFARANPSAASTFPGNLYVIGGCDGSTAGVDCSGTIYNTVYKCKISTTGALGTGGDACTTTGQVQLDSEPGTSGNQGLAVMAGAVYANYIYLIGGQSDNQTQRGTVMYAKIDDSNNIVDADGETSIDNIWETSPNEMDPARRRGIAFGYNGYLYGMAGFADDTGLQDLLFAKIDVSDGSIGPFTTSKVTIIQRWDLRAVVSSGYVYTLGGCSSGEPPATCNSLSDTVQTFQLYNNYSGSTSDYTTASNQFTTDRIGASTTILNGYIYVAGGCTSATDCTAATNSVQYAPLNADGSIGTWAAGGNLPAVRAWGQLESAGGTLYYIGGQDSTATNEQSTIYYTSSITSGNPTWNGSAASGGIGDTSSQAAQPRTKFGASVWNDRIYVVGGLDGSAAVTNTIYISPQLSSGGNIAADSWVSDADTVNVARNGHTVIAYANNLYVLGGHDGTNYLNDVQFAKINSNGTIGSWSYSTSLPQKVANADGFAANGYMYIFGGRSADTTCTNNTYIAPISANTTISSGNNPTGIGEWYQTRAAMNGAVRYGAAAAYSNGRAYIMGGGCGATLTYTGANRTQYATLQSQPQIAKYSRMIDTDTNVFPDKWLLNGIDNDIGARWELDYRSAVDSSNVILHESFDGSAASHGANIDDNDLNLGTCYNDTPNSYGDQKYDGNRYVTPGYSVNFSVTGGTGFSACDTNYDATTSYYARFYFYYSDNPPSSEILLLLDDQDDAGGVLAELRINSGSDTLSLRDNYLAEGSVDVVEDAWNRIEVGYEESTNTFETRVYSGANLHSDTPSDSDTITLNQSGRDVQTTSTTFGVTTSSATWTGVWIDDYKESYSTWVGSAFPQWGQNTNYGEVTLGTADTYTPLDSSGTDTDFARWYYFDISIDGSQAYGYPDDVTRGPTIDDLSLFFSSDPSKRLRHGKTFTGGEKQPLNTPF